MIKKQVALIKTKDDQLLEIIAKIEAAIGKDALAELSSWYQYLSKEPSNNILLEYDTKAIQSMDGFLKNG